MLEKLETENGLMPIPASGAGIGVTMDWDYVEAITLSSESFRA